MNMYVEGAHVVSGQQEHAEMKLLRLRTGLAILLLSATLVGQAAESVAKPKLAAGKTALTSRYRLVNGKGYTVCEAFLKNLNAFPADEPPMVCEQKIHPTHPEFTKPEWEEMDVQSNLNIVYAAELQIPLLYGRSEIKKPDYDEWVQLFQGRIQSGEAKPRLMKTTMALNSRGPETVIAYSPVVGACESVFKRNLYVDGSDSYLFVLRQGVPPNEDSGIRPLAVVGTDLILEYISDTLRRDVLLHKGKPYFLWPFGKPGEVDSNSKEITTFVTPTGDRYGYFSTSIVWGMRLYAVSSVTPEQSGMNGYFLQQRCEFQYPTVTQ